MRAYALGIVGIYLLILIEEVTFYLPLVVDIYGYEYELFFLHVRRYLRVRKSNNTGSLEHQANIIYARPILGRVDLHGQPWKTKVQK